MQSTDVIDALAAVHAVGPEPHPRREAWMDDPHSWISAGPGADTTVRLFLSAGGDPATITGEWPLSAVNEGPPLVGHSLANGGGLPRPYAATLAVWVVSGRLQASVSVRFQGRCVATTVNQPLDAVLAAVTSKDRAAFLKRLATAVGQPEAVWELMRLQMDSNIREARRAWVANASQAAERLSTLTGGMAFSLDTAIGKAMPAWTHDARIANRIQYAARVVYSV